VKVVEADENPPLRPTRPWASLDQRTFLWVRSFGSFAETFA
jgi:hypothetical protein